jgi:hypothetical protein
MTAFMTPVSEAYNPLPTRVLYTWKADADYVLATDRSQNTLMQYTYNQFGGQPLLSHGTRRRTPAGRPAARARSCSCRSCGKHRRGAMGPRLRFRRSRNHGAIEANNINQHRPCAGGDP